MYLDRKKIIHFLAIIACLLFGLAAIAVNLNRFWQYEAGYYDFGIFDHALWSASRFQLPIIDHLRIPGKIIFADHFNPSIFLLTPIYWISDRSETLYIAQDILVALSGYVLFRIGVLVLKNYFASFSVLVAYFLFKGLQNAIFGDVHELTLMTLFLMMTYYFILKGNKKLYFLFFIITLGFKESLFLLGIGLAIFVYFTRRDWKKTAIGTFIISVIWGFVAIKIIIPYFSGGVYLYTPTLPPTIIEGIKSLVSPIIKLKTVFWSLASFLFLPLLNLPAFFIVLLNLGSRFLSPGSLAWDLGFHYNAETAPTLGVASVLGLKLLTQKLPRGVINLVAASLIVASFVLYRFVLHGPFGLAYHPAFYKHTKDFYFLDKMIKVVPKDASVAAQNNLASRFLHRQNIRILRDDYKKYQADYILIDTRDGQSHANYLGIKDLKLLVNRILHDPGYRIVYHEGDQYVFRCVTL